MNIQIPLQEVQEGLNLSCKLGLRHLSNAKILIQNGEPKGAVILTVFGLEELGRILILKDKYQNAINEGKTFIKIKKRTQRPRDHFYNHTKKQDRAKMILPNDTLILLEGEFGEGFGKGFKTDVFLDQDLREAYTYLDYCKGWKTPRPIVVSRLKRTIIQIENALREHEKIL